jgi:hypothetical protein
MLTLLTLALSDLAISCFQLLIVFKTVLFILFTVFNYY